MRELDKRNKAIKTAIAVVTRDYSAVSDGNKEIM